MPQTGMNDITADQLQSQGSYALHLFIATTSCHISLFTNLQICQRSATASSDHYFTA